VLSSSSSALRLCAVLMGNGDFNDTASPGQSRPHDGQAVANSLSTPARTRTAAAHTSILAALYFRFGPAGASSQIGFIPTGTVLFWIFVFPPARSR